jgi:hypothetical protein
MATKTTTKAKPKKKVGRPRDTSNKVFGLPVEEAIKDLEIPFLQVDIDKASKLKPDDVNDKTNFLCCVIAQGVTRVCGAERVAILRKNAYVAFPGDGVTLRYVIEEKSRRVLEAWDRGERVVEGVKLTLRAPTKAESRVEQRKRHRAYRAKGPKATHPGRKGKKISPPDPLGSIVRNGNFVALTDA